jgi:hypothetical protein
MASKIWPLLLSHSFNDFSLWCADQPLYIASSSDSLTLPFLFSKLPLRTSCENFFLFLIFYYFDFQVILFVHKVSTLNLNRISQSLHMDVY